MAAVMLIALDIGNVCMKLNLLESNHALGLSSESPLSDEFIEISGDYESGKIPTSDFLKRLSLLTGLDEVAAVNAWNLRIGAEMPGMAEHIRYFADRGAEFVFLSDTNDLHMTKIRRTLSFANLVKGTVLSQDVGAAKPDPAMFIAFEEKYGVPDLYFDDLEKNISGAKIRNWNAVQFIDPVHFRNTVEQYLTERH